MSKRSQRLLAGVFVALLTPLSSSSAEVKPADIRLADKQVWVGQQATFYVELRAPGSFDGAAGFTLPEIPRTVIIRLGRPVVSSEEIGDETFFVQTHQFALFTQSVGLLTIPQFEARFRHRKGFTGPAVEVRTMVPEAKLEVKRPTGERDDSVYVITTNRFEVSQTWSSDRGELEQGAIVKREIQQRADKVSGMALFPPPQEASDGIRVYASSPVVSDREDRGTLRGERIDTLTYLLQKPGEATIPAIKYVWWDPETLEHKSFTLASRTFAVAERPSRLEKELTPLSPSGRWSVFLVGLVAIFLITWHRSAIKSLIHNLWEKIHRPERVSARQLELACRRNDAAAALVAWSEWEATQTPPLVMRPSLSSALTELYRCRYGATRPEWSGRTLGHAFREHLKQQEAGEAVHSSEALPQLNPASARESIN